MEQIRVGVFVHCSITEVSQLKLGNVVKGTAQTFRRRISAQKNVKRQEKLERGFPSQGAEPYEIK